MQTADLVAAIAKGKGAKFAAITYRAKESGELARHTVILGAKTEVLYEKDVTALAVMDDNGDSLRKTAISQMLASRKESLTKGIGNNSQYTQTGLWVFVEELGIKIHLVTGEVYVDALVEKKVVIEPGTYKEVKSSALTIEKNKVRRELPSHRFRTFILKNVKSAKLNGETLEIEAD